MCDERKAKLKALFDQCDTSGDGFLSIQEVARVLRASGCKLSDAEIAKDFLTDDASGDQKLSFDEFWAANNKRDPKTVKEEELRGVFQDFDKDKSGFLTESDMRKVLAGRKVSDDTIKDMITQADKNGDGKVNFEEFLTTWSSQL